MPPYAGCFYDGRGGRVAGADVEFVSQPRSGGATVLGGPVLYRKRHRRDPVSLWLAKRSDSRGDRRRLIMFCCLMAVGNALLFAFNRHYLTLITCGVMLASIANAAMPQLFALAREYADSSAREVVMFSSVMRAQLSLAW